MQLQASSGEGAFVTVLFLPTSLWLFFYSHHLPHVALADNRLQLRGRKRQVGEKKKGCFGGVRRAETNMRTVKVKSTRKQEAVEGTDKTANIQSERQNAQGVRACGAESCRQPSVQPRRRWEQGTCQAIKAQQRRLNHKSSAGL